MEVVREAGPLILGALVLAPLVLRLGRGRNSDVKVLLTLLACFVVGFVWSFAVGEQTGPDLFDRFFPVIVDTCLAFTGCSVANWLVWARLLPVPVANTNA